MDEKVVDLGGWIVKLVKGSKGQLSVYLSHQDGTEVHYLDQSLMSYNRKKVRILATQGIGAFGID